MSLDNQFFSSLLLVVPRYCPSLERQVLPDDLAKESDFSFFSSFRFSLQSTYLF